MEENRDKGEINKVKGEENVVEKKTEEKKSVVLVISVVWGKDMNKSFSFSF